LVTYLPLRCEFAAYSTKNHRNFGIKATARVESTHGQLKRLLKTRRIDLNTLLQAIEECLDRLQDNYKESHQEQTSKRVKKYNHHVTKRLRYLVGFVGLDLITKQVELALNSLKNQARPGVCTASFRLQYGVPCWHEIRGLILCNAQLQIQHVNKHWWLRHDKPLSDDFLALHNEDDPAQVVNNRNRYSAINGPQPLAVNAFTGEVQAEAVQGQSSSVQRDLSHDEVPRPRKRARRATAAQNQAQQQAQIQGLQEQLAGVAAALNSLREAQQAPPQPVFTPTPWQGGYTGSPYLAMPSPTFPTPVPSQMQAPTYMAPQGYHQVTQNMPSTVNGLQPVRPRPEMPPPATQQTGTQATRTQAPTRAPTQGTRGGRSSKASQYGEVILRFD
jgi:hypothetical protein